MRKFKDVLPRLFPNHFQIKPTNIYVKLNEELTDSTVLADARLIGRLKPTDTEISYNTLTGKFKSEGIVKIDSEYIKYTSDNGDTLSGLTRGYLDSDVTDHYNKELFTAQLASDIEAGDDVISIINLNGDPPEHGGFKIDNEYITYRYYNKYEDTFNFYQCHRGGNISVPVAHSINAVITEYEETEIQQVDTIKYDKNLYTANLTTSITKTKLEIPFDSVTEDGILSLSGEIKIDNEIIRYEDITYVVDGDNKITSGTLKSLTETVYSDSANNSVTTDTVKSLLRGIKGTSVEIHTAGTTITEVRNVIFKDSGYILIDNEYISYWYVDDNYFYVTKRGITKFGGTLPTTHDSGGFIVEYPGEDHNRNSSELIDVISEHLDYAIEDKLEDSSDLKDVSKVSADYLPYLVNAFGEDLNDYKWLDMDDRTFSQELTNIFKEKGLEGALRLWSKLGDFTDSSNNLVDLWTFNYEDFFSLLILVALIYKPVNERNLTVTNFYYPQISDTLYNELIEILNGIRFYGETLDNWTINIKSWNHLNKFDDDKLGDGGFKFDDRIAPPLYTNNRVDWEQSIWQTDHGFTTDMGPGTWTINQQWIPYIPDGESGNLKTDAIFLHTDEIPEESEIVLVHRTTGIEYKFDDEFCLDYKLDIYKHKDDIGDSGNSGYLYTSIDSDDTTIQVYDIDHPFYNPTDYNWPFTDPILDPYGYIKIDNEIMRYSSIVNDTVTGISTLFDVERAKNQTESTSHNLQPFTIFNELFNRPIVKVEYDVDGYVQTDVYRILIENDPANYNVNVGDTLILDTNDSGDDFEGTFTVSNIYREYHPAEEAWIYGIDYIDVTNPVVGLSVDFTSFLDIKQKLFNWETGWQKWTDGDDRTDDLNYPNIVVTVNDTRITKLIPVINHQYSQYQWFLWRLMNEINGDYLKDSFYNNTGVSVAKTDVGFKTNKVLPNGYWALNPERTYSTVSFQTDIPYLFDNSNVALNPLYSTYLDDILYKDISNGIIWPTPHFKWFLKVASEVAAGSTINEKLDIILYKIKEYKPKHTVLENVMSYNIGNALIDLNATLTGDATLWVSPDLDTSADIEFNPDVWVANTAYVGGNVVTETTPDGVTQYRCTIAGTSHITTEPTWNTTFGVTTTDGTVTWIAESVGFSDCQFESDGTIWSSPDLDETILFPTKESYVTSDMGLRSDGNYKAWFDYGAVEKLPVATTGRCYDFNDIDQYVNMGIFSTDIAANGVFSLSIRVKDLTLPKGTHNDSFVIYIDANNYMTVSLPQAGGLIPDIYYSLGGVSSNTVFTTSLTNNDSNIIFTFSGTSWKLYVDGVYKETVVGVDFTGLLGTSVWYLGHGTLQYFKGKMFDAKFFNKALSADEALEIYEAEYASYVNLVTNGTFDSDTIWNKSVGVTIGGGTASWDGVNEVVNLWQEISAPLIPGRKYVVKYIISNYVKGGMVLKMGYPFSAGIDRTANGTYTEVYTIIDPLTYSRMYFVGNNFFQADIDFVEVYEINEEVTFDTSLLYRDCIAWYKMNENTGTIMIDSTPNGNNGTIVNGTDEFFKPQPIVEDYEYTGNILPNGGMESWTSATDVDNWLETLAGSLTINREAVEVYQGEYSCRIDIDGSNNNSYIYQTKSLVAGQEYKTIIIYKNSVAGKVFNYRVYDDTGGEYLQLDGSWGVVQMDLPNTLTWNVLDIEFTAPSTGSYTILLKRTSGASSSIYIDSIKIEEKIPVYFQTDYMFDYNDDLTPNINADTALIENMANPICDIGYETEMIMSEIPALYGYQDTDNFYNSSDEVTLDDNYPF